MSTPFGEVTNLVLRDRSSNRASRQAPEQSILYEDDFRPTNPAPRNRQGRAALRLALDERGHENLENRDAESIIALQGSENIRPSSYVSPSPSSSSSSLSSSPPARPLAVRGRNARDIDATPHLRDNRNGDVQIYQDDTSTRRSPMRSYFGSNVPALGAIENGQKFKYQEIHAIREKMAGFMELVQENPFLATYIPPGIKAFARLVEHEYMDLPERLTGCYHWTQLEDPLDVWKWTQAKGYTRSWTPRRCSQFQRLLLRMKKLSVEEAQIKKQCHLSPGDKVLPMFQAALKALKIDNIKVTRPSTYLYRFTPVGEDEPKSRRSDFTEAEKYLIDSHFPSCWAPGEENDGSVEVDEDTKEDAECALRDELDTYAQVAQFKKDLIDEVFDLCWLHRILEE